ncbi:MAG TPA: sigma-54 dependent transcriptional regulator [Polyangia bacterium]|nr:sigma-54 dependent transcriptional regulator [Polyangia bacterium]
MRSAGLEAVEAAEGEAVEVTQRLGLAGVVLFRGGSSTLSVFEGLRRARPALPIIVVSQQPAVKEAVRLMQLGAHAYVPAVAGDGGGEATTELLEAVREILRRREAATAPDGVRRLSAVAAEHGLVGESAAMKAVLHHISLVAPTRTTVLILGETGTGKERVAQAIHQASPRRGSSFVAVNCAALSETLLESELFGHEKGAFSGAHCRREGLFKIADGGTLFLDEIGETSPALQAKLLRVLQERQFERVGGTAPVATDVRIIAATNRDLWQMVTERTFRSDLYYRLNVMVIRVPALRDRREDIGRLVGHVLTRLSFDLGIPAPPMTPAVLSRLAEHTWPGNVRELENVLERLLVISQDRSVGLGDIVAEIIGGASVRSVAAGGQGEHPAEGDRPTIPGASFKEIERHAILATYEACDQSPTRTARVLGLSLRTVHYRLREYRGEVGRRATPIIPWRPHIVGGAR